MHNSLGEGRGAGWMQGAVLGAVLGAIAVATMLLPHQAGAQPARAREQARVTQLDAYVSKTMQDWKVPGVALAIVRNDSIVYAKGYGTRTIGQSQPVDANTIFAIGSSSKAFTAALAAMAVDAGKMKWDEKVSAYLPGFQMHDTYASRELTLRDALSHRSGLARGDFAWYLSGFSRPEILRRVRHLAPSWGFRSQFGYQNLMYLAAGESVAAAEGASWDDLVQTKLFTPLGMTSSSTTVRALASQQNVATPHVTVSDTVRTVPWKNIDNIAPAGSINSNVRDMAQWVRLQLGRGRYAGQQLISSGNLGEMWHPNTHIRLEGPAAKYLAPGANLSSYGLGWFLQDFHGRLAVHHGGNIDGMSAMVAMLPDEQLGVVILTNLDGSPAPVAIFPYVFELFTGVTPKDWSAEYRTLLEPMLQQGKAAEAAVVAGRVQGTRPSLALPSYAGSYSDSLYGEVTISEANGALRVMWGAFGGSLEHWHYDSFRATMDSPRLGKVMTAFVLDLQGKPAELKLEIAPEARFRRMPPKADTRAAVTMSEAELQRYAGSYKATDLPITIEVQVVGGQLKATVPGQPTYTLVPENSSRFRLAADGIPPGFYLDFDVSGPSIAGATLVQPAPRPPLKLTRQ